MTVTSKKVKEEKKIEIDGQIYNKEGRSDLTKIDPRLVIVDETFNIRKDYGDINELMLSIIENGVIKPLQGKRQGKFFILTDGFRRMRAILAAISLGHDIGRIPFLLEKQSKTDEARIFDMFTSNSGKPLTSLEEGDGFDRLVKYGYKRKEIAKKLGKSEVHISNMLKLMGAPKTIRDQISTGIISSSVAIEIMRQHPNDEEKQKEVISDAVKDATSKAEVSGKKAKVTAKNVQSLKGKNPLATLKEVRDVLAVEGVENDKTALLDRIINNLNKKVPAEELLKIFL